MFQYHLALAEEHPLLCEGQVEAGLLSPREERILQTLSFPQRRRKWLLGRAAAKRVLAEHPATRELDSRRLSVLNEPSGAPYVMVDETLWDYSLSISHRQSVGLAVAGLQPGIPLGADVETIEPRDPALVRQYFTDGEAAWVDENPMERDLRVTLIWSAKESVLKALGIGLRMDTRRIECTPAPEDDARGEWGVLHGQWSPDEAATQPRQRLRILWLKKTNLVLTVAELPLPGER